MKLFSLVVQVLMLHTTLPLIAQTGPAGVGATNGTSNLSLWLDAGRITGVTNGNSLFSWKDLSGNGYDAFVPVSVDLNAPTYSVSGGGNGQPAVNFNGSQGMAVPGNSETMPTNELTLFVAGLMMNGAGSYDIFVSASADDADNDGYGIFQDNNNDRMGLWTKKWGERVTINGLGTEEVWCLFNTTVGLNYGYKSESAPITKASIGSITYKGTGPNYDVQIGTATNNTTFAYFLLGHIEEIVLFDVAINNAQRIIISNYLAAKYNVALANNNVYDEDNAGNGNYDNEVAGIGRIDATNIHNDAQGTGMVRIRNPTGLEDNEFLMWGHDNGIPYATETTDVPPGVQARFDRVWRVSEVNTAGTAVNVGNIDMRWDLNGLEGVTASDLRLLIDDDNNGNFANDTPISGAIDLGGGIYEFKNVPDLAGGIRNNRRFTIGTINFTQTPLPIKLVFFDAKNIDNRKVKLEWETASEIIDEFFTIERSTNAIDWEIIKTVDGAGNFGTILNYFTVDESPYSGVSYYRLKQTDFDGKYEYSNIKNVNLNVSEKENLHFYPNPADHLITITGSKIELSSFQIINTLGQNVTKFVHITTQNESTLLVYLENLSQGMYYLKTKTTSNKVYKQ